MSFLRVLSRQLVDSRSILPVAGKTVHPITTIVFKSRSFSRNFSDTINMKRATVINLIKRGALSLKDDSNLQDDMEMALTAIECNWRNSFDVSARVVNR